MLYKLVSKFLFKYLINNYCRCIYVYSKKNIKLIKNVNSEKCIF